MLNQRFAGQRKRLLMGGIAGAMLLSITVVFAQGPLPQSPQVALGTGFTYQGQLKKNNAPFNGMCSMTFSLWDSQSNGTGQVGGSQLINPVAVANGLFTVVLNGVNQFGSSAFTGQDRWLQTSVQCTGDAGATTLSRQQLSAAPYALFSAAPWVTSGSNVYFSAGNVGIGTNSPLTLLHLKGNTSSGANNTAVFENTAIGPYASSIHYGLNGDWYIRSAAASGKVVIQDTGGNVGIRTSTPSQALEVNGITSLGSPGSVYGYMLAGSSPGPYPTLGFNTYDSTYLAGLAGYGGVFQFQDGDGKLIYYTGSNVPAGSPHVNIARLMIDASGNVGVGTTNPTNGKLEVQASGIAVYGSGSNGVYGHSTGNVGVVGYSESGTGAYGSGNIGVEGYSSGGSALYGHSPGSGTGVHGDSATGYAGYFDNKVYVGGVLEKPGGGFKIDHPLDPANQYLYHSFVESPDMMDVYNGNVTTDAQGDATVVLPDWFEVLNRDFRYQLTVVGKQWAQARVEEEIQDNRFSIKTDKPNVKVSWQVTGIRHDPWAEQNRIPVEEEKPPAERGKYLHPKEYGVPEALGIDYDNLHAQAQGAQGR